MDFACLPEVCKRCGVGGIWVCLRSGDNVWMDELPNIDAAYMEDLAFVHDDSFGFIATGAAKTVAAKLTERGINGGLIVELACGSGISSALLLSAGYDVLGFDISAPMIELARERANDVPQPPLPFGVRTLERTPPSARFEVASLYDAEIPSCVAVTGIGEAFNYLFDPRAGFDSMCDVFERAWDAIVPGGVLMFDIAEPGRALPRLEHHFWEGEGWRVVSETIEHTTERILERKITTTRTIAGENRESVELHRLALYDHEEVYEALREIGFAPLTLASYAEDFRFGHGHGAFMAVKPFDRR